MSCRPPLAGVLLVCASVLFGSMPAGAAGSPAGSDGSRQLHLTWSAPGLSVRTPPAEVVAAGTAHAQATNDEGELRVLSVHAVDGRPEVTTAVVAGEAAAVREVAARQQDAGIVSVEIDVPRRLSATAVTAPDQYRGEQWALDDLQVERVWPRGTGSGVVIAVIDTGVDATHPDLAGRVLTGAAFPPDGRPGTSPVNPHGTHVAGIAVAIANNGIGIAGVAPSATVLPVRTFDETGWADTSALVDGIIYAADEGADIINMSYTAAETSEAERAAVNYARSKGAVLFAAGGNAGQVEPAGTPVYPAALDGVIGVSNLENRTGRINPITNAGTFIDVSAPGTDILSTMPGNRYDRMTGTSMAAPAAAGVAALLLSVHPGLTAGQVEQALIAGAEDLEQPGYDLLSGFGRLSAPGALNQADCIVDGGCAPAQNLLTGNRNQALVNRAYVELFARNASGADLRAWDTRLRGGATPVTLGDSLTASDEFRQRFLVRSYDRFLRRTPTAGEVSGWVGAMRSGRTQPQVEAAFLGSPEFYTRSGGTRAGFVTGLYQSVLNRTPSQAEVTHWTTVLDRGVSREGVALGFTRSAEYQARQVDGWYRSLLGRAPTAAELHAGVTRIISGGRIENVIATIIGHWEFSALAGQRFGSTGLPLRTGN